ncbi:MAG: cytochrome o ubiquinol oxidase subunit IV [Bacteroidales bacterium]|nr:cytochrome o ubiquinol oxidase subunit IV [Bacteroidales bacterium]
MSQEAHNENMGAGHISTKHYIVGFVLAVLLTVVSFGFVMTDVVSKQVAVIGLFVAAVLQMLVHLHYFLHLDRSSEQRWNVIALAFTALLLFIFVAGTMWVMYTLNSRMM